MPSLFFRIRSLRLLQRLLFRNVSASHSFQSWGAAFASVFLPTQYHIFSVAPLMTVLLHFPLWFLFLSYLFLYRHYFTLWTPGRSVLPEIQPGMEPFHSLLFHNRFYGIFTHFLHRLMNGRNGRIRQCGNPGIIESHNRDILRNTFSHFLHARIIFAAITSLVAKIPSRSEFFSIIPKYCCRILLIREPTCLYKPHVH